MPPTRPTIDLGIHLWAQNTSWLEIREAALRAESSGYRYVWTWDHLYAIFGDPTQPALEGWTLLAALAASTSRAELGLLVTANPFRNPGVLAKMAATVDEISGGRLVLGMGAAWNALEHAAHGLEFGQSPGQRIAWLEESIQVVRALFSGKEVSSPPGGHYALDRARHAPPPVRGSIPLLIGGGGERRTLRLVAEHADLWNAMGTADQLARKQTVLDEHCAAVGRDPAAIRRSVTVRVLIRDEPGDARAVWADLMSGLGVTDADMPAFTGPPRQVAERLQPYIDAGFDTLIIELPAPYDPETLERLASDVLPLLRVRGTG